MDRITEEFIAYRNAWYHTHIKRDAEDAIDGDFLFDMADHATAVLENAGISTREQLEHVLDQAQTQGVINIREAKVWRNVADQMITPANPHSPPSRVRLNDSSPPRTQAEASEPPAL